MKYWLIFFLMLPIPGFTNQVIRIKSYVKVTQKKQLVLLDLVDNQITDKKLELLLQSIELGNAPKIGERRDFTGRGLSLALRKALLKDKQVQIKIPRNIVVENPGIELTQLVLKKELMKSWKAICADCKYKDAIFTYRISQEKIQTIIGG